MSLERLWAGWRSAYVGQAVESFKRESQSGQQPLCVLCELAAANKLGGPGDEAAYVVARRSGCYAVLNAFPYASGHMMIVPERHVASLAELEEEEFLGMRELLLEGIGALEEVYHPDGFNAGVNLGRAAGAGVPGHLHLHVVPRWAGDTNFMGSLAEVRVLPESLPETYSKLASAWPSDAKASGPRKSRKTVAEDYADLEAKIRNVPDFPRPGVAFKDVTPLLADPATFSKAVGAIAGKFEGTQVDRVVGIEARGFILAAPVAERLGAGFVPARKAGKLPGPVVGEDYELEYATERLEVPVGLIDTGDKVLVVDDVLATGGTALATIALVERLGATVVGLGFLLELAALNGASRLASWPTVSLLTL
jgi:adenine phosphoribosyltransferase